MAAAREASAAQEVSAGAGSRPNKAQIRGKERPRKRARHDEANKAVSGAAAGGAQAEGRSKQVVGGVAVGSGVDEGNGVLSQQCSEQERGSVPAAASAQLQALWQQGEGSEGGKGCMMTACVVPAAAADAELACRHAAAAACLWQGLEAGGHVNAGN